MCWKDEIYNIRMYMYLHGTTGAADALYVHVDACVCVHTCVCVLHVSCYSYTS